MRPRNSPSIAQIDRSSDRSSDQERGLSYLFDCVPPQKRAADRAQKVKKVGARYYETHNVKNKNRNKRTAGPTAEGQKAKLAKH